MAESMLHSTLEVSGGTGAVYHNQCCPDAWRGCQILPHVSTDGQEDAYAFDEMRRYRHINPKDNEACEAAIRRQDEIDIQLKQLQQEYHARFMTVLPAYKVLSVIKAEEKFHRQAFRRMHK